RRPIPKMSCTYDGRSRRYPGLRLALGVAPLSNRLGNGMTPAMDISPEGLVALAGREGVRTLAYRDTRGIWTIGIGHTGSAGPPHPCEGMEITHQQALDLFREDLKQYVAAVNGAVKVP